MSNQAMSFLGGIGIGEESTYGTPAAITDWLQANAETMSYQQAQDMSAAIFTDSEMIDTIPGRIVVGGGVTIPAYGGAGFARMLKFANRATSSSAIPYTASLTYATPAAGGDLASGTYQCKIAHVLQHLRSGRLYLTNPSTVHSVGLGAGEGTIDYTWPAPSAGDIPFGYQHAGTMLMRSESGGSNVFLAVYVPGSSTSASDDGSQALSTVAAPAAMYRHRFTGSHDQPRSFTLECVDDNGYSRVFTGCMVNQVGITIRPGERVSSQFDLFGQTMESLPSSTPSPTAINGLHGKDAFVYVRDSNGTYTANNLVNSFDVTLNNKLNRRDNLNGTAYVRAIRAQMREIKGSADFDFESLEQLNDMLEHRCKDILVVVFGPSSCQPFHQGSYVVHGWPSQLQIHVPNFQFDSSASNLSADAPVINRLPFVARKSASAGYALQIEAHNTASSL
jgi:hypothetical protein